MMKSLLSFCGCVVLMLFILPTMTFASGVAPSDFNFGGSGVQPETPVNITVQIENQDQSVDSYVYSVMSDVAGNWSIPQMTGEYARSIQGTVNYQIVMRNPQSSFSNNRYIDGGGNVALYNREVTQSMSFDWNRLSQGVRFSGQMTPNGTLTANSPTDGAFGGFYDEYDDRNEYYSAVANSFVSVGDYISPYFNHVTAQVGISDFGIVIQNTDIDLFGPGPYIGTPINQTAFNFDIFTTIPPLPPSQSGNAGNPNAGGGSSTAAVLAAGAAFLASLFGMSQAEVQDAYAGEPLGDMAEQITMSNNKEIEGISTIKTAEQQDKAAADIQSITTDVVNDLQVSDPVCEISSLTSLGHASALFHRQNNRNLLRRGLMANATGVRGSNGALLASEKRQLRREEFRTRNCNPSESNGGLAAFCAGSPASDTDMNRDVDAVFCLLGSETIDSDPSNGLADDSCIAAISYVSPAFKPIAMPSEALLSGEGSEEVDEGIMEFVPALGQHGSLISDALATMHAKTIKSPAGAAVDEFRGLLVELGFDNNHISRYIPTTGGGLSENAQLEVISKYMIANPSFIMKLQDNEASVLRVRALLRGVALRLDDQISDLIAIKGQHFAAPTAIMLRDDRERANSGLLRANK
jgi:hypothetical protein